MEAHLRYARFCERVHAASDAIREYSLVMELQPSNKIALQRLAFLERQIHEEGRSVEPPDAPRAPSAPAPARN